MRSLRPGRDDVRPGPVGWRQLRRLMLLGIAVDDVEQFGVDAHLAQIEPELLAKQRGQALAAVLGPAFGHLTILSSFAAFFRDAVGASSSWGYSARMMPIRARCRRRARRPASAPTSQTRSVAAKDCLDVVAVGIKNKRRIILRAALARWPIVGSAFPERSSEKSFDLGSIPRHERGMLTDRMRVKSINPEDWILDAVTDAIGSNI